MFHFPGFALHGVEYSIFKCCELPHSEISGSKVATHLPGTFRSYATSFIASLCLGIHHILLGSIGNPKNHLSREIDLFDDFCKPLLLSKKRITLFIDMFISWDVTATFF